MKSFIKTAALSFLTVSSLSLTVATQTQAQNQAAYFTQPSPTYTTYSELDRLQYQENLRLRREMNRNKMYRIGMESINQRYESLYN